MYYYILIGALVAYIAIVAIFQLKKSKQRGSKTAKKVAFFHPFWYSVSYSAMMEEEVRKCYGL